MCIPNYLSRVIRMTLVVLARVAQRHRRVLIPPKRRVQRHRPRDIAILEPRPRLHGIYTMILICQQRLAPWPFLLLLPLLLLVLLLSKTHQHLPRPSRPRPVPSVPGMPTKAQIQPVARQIHAPRRERPVPPTAPVVAVIVPAKHGPQARRGKQRLHQGDVLPVVGKRRRGGALASLHALLREGHVLVEAGLLVGLDLSVVLQREEGIDGDVDKSQGGDAAAGGAVGMGAVGAGEVGVGLGEPGDDVGADPVGLADGEAGR